MHQQQNDQQTATGVPVQVVPQVENQHRFVGRDVTKEEKRCCCTFTRASACTFVVFMCIGGMACIAAGTAQAVMHAAKYTTVEEYNDDIRRLESKYPRGFLAGTTQNVASITVRQPYGSKADGSVEAVATGSKYTVRPVYQDHYDEEDVEVMEYDAYMYSTTVPNWQAGALARFTISTTVGSRSESVIRGIPATKSMVEPVTCKLETCDRNCEHHMKCTQKTLQSYCEHTYGAGSTYSGEDKCHEGDTCGTCRFEGQLQRVCVVTEEKFADGFNHHLDSCYYPFKADSQIYGAPSQFNHSVKVEFRSAADPFITMQRLTEGKMDFEHHLKNGFAGQVLIFVGLALMIVPTSILCCYRCCCYKANNGRRHAEEGDQDHHADNQTQVVAMHPLPAAANPVAMAPAYPVAEGVVTQHHTVRPTLNPVAAPSAARHAAADPFHDPNAIVTPHKDVGSRTF